MNERDGERESSVTQEPLVDDDGNFVGTLTEATAREVRDFFDELHRTDEEYSSRMFHECLHLSASAREDNIRDRRLRKEIYSHYHWALSVLANFGIQDLTLIEQVRLRKIVEDCFFEVEKIQDKSYTAFVVSGEAVERWFLELYGISAHFIPQYCILRDGTTGEIFRFGSREKEKIQQKQKELHRLRHLCSTDFEVTGDFKEYIRRVREQAHHP